MSFLNPWFLWALIATAIPVAIHFLHKRRYQTLPWAAMSFLLKATKEYRGHKRLRHILILSLRCLILATIILAAANPLISNLLSWRSSQVQTVIILFDRSASMEQQISENGHSQREAMLHEITRTLRLLGSPHTLLIDSATLQPTEIANPSLLNDLLSTKGSDTTADFPAILSQCTDWLSRHDESTEIWIASDLQESNWLPNDPRWESIRSTYSHLSKKPTFRFIRPIVSETQNLSLHMHQCRRIGKQFFIELEILRPQSATGMADIPITTHINGTQSTEHIHFNGSSYRFQKSIALTADQSSGFGHITLPPDSNPNDNTAYIAYGQDQPMKTLVFSESNPESSRILLAAAAPHQLAGFSSQLLAVKSLADTPLENTQLIIWDAPLPAGKNNLLLETYLKKGGQVLFLPQGNQDETSFLGIRYTNVNQANADAVFQINQWNHRDGPLRDGLAGTPLPIERFKAIKRQCPTGDALIDASFTDNEVFLSHAFADAGTAWFLSTNTQYTWSNLGDADVLLPLVQRILQQSAELYSRPFFAYLNSPQAIPSETAHVALLTGTLTDFRPPFTQSGVYQFDQQLIALNRPPHEDNLEKLSVEQLKTIFSPLPITLIDQAGKDKTDADTNTAWWQPLLLAAGLFLLLESWLCLPKTSAKNLSNHP